MNSTFQKLQWKNSCSLINVKWSIITNTIYFFKNICQHSYTLIVVQYWIINHTVVNFQTLKPFKKNAMHHNFLLMKIFTMMWLLLLVTKYDYQCTCFYFYLINICYIILFFFYKNIRYDFSVNEKHIGCVWLVGYSLRLD